MTVDWQTFGITAGVLFTAAWISFFSSPAVAGAARRVGAMDVPRDGRRMHDHPIPRLGGLAIFFGFALTVPLLLPRIRPLAGLLLGAYVMLGMGAADDVRPLSPRAKLLLQFAAALPAVGTGSLLPLPAPLAAPLSLVWIVLAANAVNLMDGLDGLACGLSAISASTLLAACLGTRNLSGALLSAGILGGCLGFLPGNRSPASIFMGDTGSCLLGYLLSVTGLYCLSGPPAQAVGAELLILALPVADAIWAILRRLARGQSPMAADRGHIHHRLVDAGLPQPLAAAILWTVHTAACLLALALLWV